MVLSNQWESGRTRRLLLATVAVAFLWAGFLCNTWRVAEPGWFDRFQRDTEGLVLGRLVKSRQDGLLAAGGFNGAGGVTTLRDYPESADHLRMQYATYLEGGEFSDFAPYLSQHGGQGMVFGALDRLLPLSTETKLALFYLLTAFLSALVLGAIVNWFYLEFGGWAAASVAVSMILSQWLTVFGRNLWWSLWVFYLPLLATLYHPRKGVGDVQSARRSLGLLVFALVLLKCFVNGYEYITTALIMLLVPIAYYAVRDGWGVRRTVELASSALVASGAAVVVSVTVLTFQIGVVRESMAEGLSYLMFRLGIRSHGGVDVLPERFADGVDANTWTVIATYLEGAYVDIEHYVQATGFLSEALVVAVSYWHLIVLFGVGSAALIALGRRATSARRRGRRNTALVCATWFSILAPLSWFVVFKAHSHVHTHMNFIVWQMPFTFFGFAVVGSTFREAIAH